MQHEGTGEGGLIHSHMMMNNNMSIFYNIYMYVYMCVCMRVSVSIYKSSEVIETILSTSKALAISLTYKSATSSIFGSIPSCSLIEVALFIFQTTHFKSI